MSDNANSHPLIVDLKDHTPALEHDALFEAYNEGATADEKELERESASVVQRTD